MVKNEYSVFWFPCLLRLLSSCGFCWQKFVRQTSWPEKNFSNGQLSNNGGKLAFASFSCSKQNKQGHKFGPKRDSGTLFVFLFQKWLLPWRYLRVPSCPIFGGFPNIPKVLRHARTPSAAWNFYISCTRADFGKYWKISIKSNQFLEIATLMLLTCVFTKIKLDTKLNRLFLHSLHLPRLLLVFHILHLQSVTS